MPDAPAAPAPTLDAALLAGLVDDAALFPPGLAPLDVAVREHLATRDSPRADWIGPFVLPVPAVDALLTLLLDAGTAGALSDRPLRLTLVARPGTAPGSVADAVAAVRAQEGLALAGLDLPADAHDGASERDLPLTLEVPRRPEDFVPVLTRLARESADRAGGHLRVKYRTQAVEHAPVPSASDLALFLTHAVDVGLPVKLTGGLHHAVGRGLSLQDAHDVYVDPGCDPMTPAAHADPHAHGRGRDCSAHGVLNVLVAAEAAAAGSSAEDVRAALALDRHDTAHLAAAAAAIRGDRAHALRRTFTAFGCCSVHEPLDELEALGLLPGGR